jgi:probable phosphoglycerate mutase
MHILLVRHGETASNAARVVQTPDTPLSDRGVEQAERLALRLAGEPVGSILCSTLCRATMTAEPLSAALNVPLTLRADLQERNYGDIRGLAYDEVGANILDSDYDPPGGETWREFHQRVDGAWRFLAKMARELTDDSNERVVVVTHGLVLHSLVSRLLDTSRLAHVPVGFANTSVTAVERLPPWRVTTLNCTVHLD